MNTYFKKFRKKIAIFLVAISVIILVPTNYFHVSASTDIITTSDGFTFDKSTGTLSDYSGNEANVIIPCEIEGVEVQIIYQSAFSTNNAHCNTVTIPKTVKKIGENAFYSNSIVDINVDNENKYFSSENGVLFDKNKVKLYAYPGGKRESSYCLPNTTENIGRWAFSYNFYVKNVYLPNGIKKIEDTAFWGSNIESIYIPDSVTEIGESCFTHCKELKEVRLSENINKISRDLFSWCKSLININIPSRVTSIESGAFKNCESLKNISLPENITYLNEDLFSGCSSLMNVKIPDKVTGIGYDVFDHCKSLESIVIPDSVVECGQGVFSYCEKLKSIKISNNMKYIPGFFLYACCSIEEVEIPESVTFISRNSFDCCFKLKDINMHKNLQIVASWSFSSCSSLTSVNIPETVTDIYQYAFYDCKNLTKIIIPKSVKSIEANSFQGCDNVTIYGYEGSYAQQYAFTNNIPFYSLDGFNRTYALKIIDKGTKMPIPGVNITSDSGIASTNESGIAMLPLVKSSSFKLNITKEGYKTISETKFLIANTINTIELEKSSNNIAGLNFVNPPESSDTLYGPQISFFNKTSNIFKIDIGTKQPWFNDIQYEVDTDNKTIKVLMGLKEKIEVKPDSDNPGDSYWKQSYNDIKDLVNRYGGKVETNDLWNKYSKVRGKLKKIDSKAGFSCSGYIAGYAEFSYKDNGTATLIDGGALFTAEAGVSQKTPFGFLPIAYVKFGISGGFGGELKLVIKESQDVMYNGQLNFFVKPTIGLGIGPEKIANAEMGINGKINCAFDVPRTISEGFEAKLSAECYIKASLLNGLYEDCKSFKFDDVTLYTNKNKKDLSKNYNYGISQDNFKLASRDYLSKGNMLLKNMYNTSFDSNYIKQNIYPYCNPIMKNLSNGKRILVWIDDLGADKRTPINRTCLMYSVYNGESWSIPKEVYNDGTGDFSPSLYVKGDKAYLVWLNANKVFSDNATYEEVCSSCDINLSEFNGESFLEPVNINDNGNSKFENYPKVSANNEEVSVTWVENSNNDPFMQSGKNTIYRRKYSKGNLQTTEKLKDDLNIIYDIDTDYVNDKNLVAYSYDKDGDFNTDGDTELNIIKDNENNISDIGNIEGLQFVDGSLYWNLDGKIKMLANDNTLSATEVGDIGQSGDFKVVEGEKNKVFLWLNKDGFKSEIQGAYYDKDNKTLSNPIKLTNSEKGIRTFSPILKEDGKLSVAYNISDIEEVDGSDKSPYGKTDLIVDEDLKNFDLQVNEFLEYEEGSIVGGNEINLKAKVKNNSFENIDKLKITLLNDKDEEIKEDIVSCSIKPGEDSEVQTSYKLPNEIRRHKVKMYISRVEGEEKNTENNYAVAEFGYADLAFKDYSLAKDDTGYFVKGKIINKGFDIANNINVSLNKDGIYGKKLDNIEISSLGVNEEKEFIFRISDADNVFVNELNNNLFSLEVTSDSIESNLSNNNVNLFSNPIKATSIAIDKSELNINNNNKKTLIASVLPINAINHNVIWLSSNSEVATVDENGVITAKSQGEVIISATSMDGNYTAKCKVKVFNEYDFNYDGKVDKLDLALILNSYNALKGDANYIEEMDVNKDGIIDIYDISVVSNSIKE